MPSHWEVVWLDESKQRRGFIKRFTCCFPHELLRHCRNHQIHLAIDPGLSKPMGHCDAVYRNGALMAMSTRAVIYFERFGVDPYNVIRGAHARHLLAGLERLAFTVIRDDVWRAESPYRYDAACREVSWERRTPFFDRIRRLKELRRQREVAGLARLAIETGTPVEDIELDRRPSRNPKTGLPWTTAAERKARRLERIAVIKRLPLTLGEFHR